MRQPGPCVRALCEAVALMLSKNVTCARPWRNATPSEHFPHTSQCTLHTLHFALHTCTSHSTLHLTSNHVSSSHLIPSLLTCHPSKFFSTVFISSEHWSTFLISSKFVSTHLSFSARQKALTVRGKFHAQRPLGAESFCTQTLETQMHLHRKAFPKYLVLQSLHKVFPSTTLYYKYKACTKHVPVPLLLLQSLHQALPSTTLHYKASKHVWVVLCTTRLAQSKSQYYFVLQNLHKHLISPHLRSSHLIPSLLTCHLGKFFSAVFTSSEHWSTYLL